MGLLRLPEILASLLARFWYINVYHEAAWTDSWCHRHCLHAHQNAHRRSKMRHAGWYVFAVESGRPRELNDEEEDVVNKFRFGRMDQLIRR